MSAIRLTQSDAMMTTKFMPSVSRTPWLPEHFAENRIRMNWAVVTDHRGARELRLNWNTEPGT